MLDAPQRKGERLLKPRGGFGVLGMDTYARQSYRGLGALETNGFGPGQKTVNCSRGLAAMNPTIECMHV